MYKHFSSDFFSNNRKQLRTLFTGTAPIIIPAHGLLQRNNDSTYAFRQDSNFWYLTGIMDPDVVLVMDKTQDYLIVPQYEHTKEIFDGAIDTAALSQVSGIEQVLSEKEGWKKLGTRLRRVKHAAVLSPPASYIKHYGMFTNPARRVLKERILNENPQLELLDIAPHLARMRMIKQAPELAAIEEAIAATAKAIKAIQKKAYDYEYEIEAKISYEFRRQGCQGHGFTPIVSSGQRACVLHHTENNGAIGAGELIVVDIGAEVENYSADITRTYSQDKITKRQRAVHAAVVEAQDYAKSLLKPGVLLHDYEKEVEHFMGEKLRELGLIRSISHEAVRQYYPHATSHFLGLDVHDVGDYQRPLEPGVVLTVEPGIYIDAEGIGVRIEDDILITQKGNTVLSASLPRELV